MTKKYFVTVLTLFTVILPTWATEEIGLEILDTCLSERRAILGDPVSSVRYGLCLGYLKGVADSLNGRVVCLPEGMGTAELTQALKYAYLDYAKTHQEELKAAAKKTVLPALEQVFPCNMQN